MRLRLRLAPSLKLRRPREAKVIIARGKDELKKR